MSTENFGRFGIRTRETFFPGFVTMEEAQTELDNYPEKYGEGAITTELTAEVEHEIQKNKIVSITAKKK